MDSSGNSDGVCENRIDVLKVRVHMPRWTNWGWFGLRYTPRRKINEVIIDTGMTIELSNDNDAKGGFEV